MTPQAHCISVHVIYQQKFLLLRRTADYLRGTWQMVTGGIDEGEKAYEAALREVKEETGLVPRYLYTADAVETFYMKVLDKIAFVPTFVAFVDQTEVRLTEHDLYEWLSFEQARERLIFSEQKRVITHVYQNFVLKDPDPIFLL